MTKKKKKPPVRTEDGARTVLRWDPSLQTVKTAVVTGIPLDHLRPPGHGALTDNVSYGTKLVSNLDGKISGWKSRVNPMMPYPLLYQPLMERLAFYRR